MNKRDVLIMGILSLLFISCSSLKGGGDIPIAIHVNQVGYALGQEKKAVVVGYSGYFSLLREGQEVFRGSTGKKIKDAAAGEKVRQLDFSTYNEAGVYTIKLEEGTESYPFIIDEDPYRGVHLGVLKNLYFYRCGVELTPEYADIWKHPACHLKPSILLSDESVAIDVTGGWHDAGDYGKYTVPGVTAAAMMLFAYEIMPDRFDDDLNIPESGNGIPDILDEIRVELEFLLKMQDPDTGGVYHKVTTKNFGGNMMPHIERGTYYISDVSPTAAGDFAALMAMAYPFYEKLDKDFADSMKIAAMKAFRWMEDNPTYPQFKNAPDVRTGEYGDHNSDDEKFWAAVELFELTGEAHYQKTAESLYPTLGNPFALGWQDMGGFGSFSILFDQKWSDSSLKSHIQESFKASIAAYQRDSQKKGYRIGLPPESYGWGSNMTVLNKGVELVLASRLFKEDSYLINAVDHLDYILGRNPLGYSYVTGFGDKYPMNPHHRPSVSDFKKEPVPGMVVGGPNQGLQDPGAFTNIEPGTAPMKCYIDLNNSYSTNEVTIYWNAPAVFLTAALLK